MKIVVNHLSYVSHCIVWLLTVSLYTPVFFVLYSSRWKASDYTHAYFILPIFIWMVWRKRVILKKSFSINVCHNYGGIFVFLFGIVLYMFGWRLDYTFLFTLSLIPVLYGLVSTLYGVRLLKPLYFPLSYLILLVPIPIGIVDDITIPLRHGISVATEVTLKTFHYPVERKGLLLIIGGSELFMGQPCSGFRYLVTMFSLSLLYAYIARGGMIKKGILAFSIIPFALAGNLIRVLTICLITYYFGEAAGQGFFHDFSGVVVFVIIILELVGVELILNGRKYESTR